MTNDRAIYRASSKIKRSNVDTSNCFIIKKKLTNIFFANYHLNDANKNYI